MPKRARREEEEAPLQQSEMLLLFSVGLDWEKYKMCVPLPPDVLAIIVEYSLDTLRLVRERRHGDLYSDSDGVSAKWLCRFMDITRRPSDAPYGEAFERRGLSTKDRVRKGNVMRPGTMDMYTFLCNTIPRFPHGHTSWNAKQWKWFLTDRLTTCLKRVSILSHIRDIYDHSTRFYVAGFGRSYRHQFMLYEPYIQTQPGFEAVESHLRLILGSSNFDRFVRLRLMRGGMQVFFFGPAVDIDTVMSNPIFKEHSYFEGLRDTGNMSLLRWLRWRDGPYLECTPAFLAAKGCHRALRVQFK